MAARPAEAVVLLHGLASNATRWWRLPPEFAGYRLLRPSLRGHAGSHDRGRIGMDEWCADLVALLDAQGCARAFVGGHCLGANIALNFAARHPQRTAGLILIEPMPREALIGSMRTVFLLRHFFKALSLVARGWNSVGLKRKTIQPMDLEQWDKAAASGELPLANFATPLGDLKSVPTAAYLQSLCAVFEPLPPAAAILCPVLALISGRSTMTDPQRTRAAMKTLNAEIVDLDAEHWIPTERPTEMRAAIESWLAGLKA